MTGVRIRTKVSAVILFAMLFGLPMLKIDCEEPDWRGPDGWRTSVVR